MAFVYGDRVKETSTSTFTGPMVFGGPTLGFQSFAAGVGIGNECFYGIFHVADNDWEMGRGTVGAASLSRDTVFSSSNSNNLVEFTGGDKLVFTTVPNVFYAGALDSTSHELIDHTTGALSLLDAIGHDAIDHTALTVPLMTVASHDATDHTVAPFDLLDIPAHEGVDHTVAPFDLLDIPAHEGVDHKIGPFFLLDAAAHNALNHNLVTTGNNPGPVGISERTAGASTPPLELRSFTPEDIALMAGIHGGGGGAGLQVATFSPTTFGWLAQSTAIDTGVLSFTPVVAFAFATFHHETTPTTGLWTTATVGVATASFSYSQGQLAQTGGSSNDMPTTFEVGSIAGFSTIQPAAYKLAWDIATVGVTWNGISGIVLTPSTAITGNLTLIVLG